MRPSEALQLNRENIRQIVAECHAKNARVFGSVVHGDDNEQSDLDLLVDTTSDTSLLDIARLQNRLQKLMKISVDVLTPNALPTRFRAQVLKEAKLV